MSKRLEGKLVKISAERMLDLLIMEDELIELKNIGVDNWNDYGHHLENCEDEETLIAEVEKIIII